MGKSKGKRAIDAIDDKEYSGNIIMLLKEGISFIKNNSQKAWKIEGAKRIEYIDYPDGKFLGKRDRSGRRRFHHHA